MTAEDVAKSIDGKWFEVVADRSLVGTRFDVVCKCCGKVVFSFDECCGLREVTAAALLTEKHKIRHIERGESCAGVIDRISRHRKYVERAIFTR